MKETVRGERKERTPERKDELIPPTKPAGTKISILPPGNFSRGRR